MRTDVVAILSVVQLILAATLLVLWTLHMRAHKHAECPSRSREEAQNLARTDVLAKYRPPQPTRRRSDR